MIGKQDFRVSRDGGESVEDYWVRGCRHCRLMAIRRIKRGVERNGREEGEKEERLDIEVD